MPLKTLFLNPPSFENYDGGASSRWPATREIESYWYPVWLAYPAGMLEGSRLLDAPPHHVSFDETIQISKDYDFVVLFTSTPGFPGDLKIAKAMKTANPNVKIAFVGPHVTTLPERSLAEGPEIDFIVRREFDYAVVEYANGKPLNEITGVSYRGADGKVVHNPDRPPVSNLDEMPDVIDVYKRDLDVKRYNVPFLLHPYIALYTTRGCPAQCTFCLWPQTLSGHPWRKRSSDAVASEMKRAMELFPWVREFFFDDDTFNIQKARTIELCEKLKPLGMTWSCTSRVTTDYETLKAMKEAGCRLLIVGYESGDPQILKNIKKGATVERARAFTKDCHKLGLKVHGDFILGLPGETKETIRRTMDFAKELDVETIQVSIAHAYPGTELYDYAKANGFIVQEGAAMVDDQGHQVAMIEYPGLPRDYVMEMVHKFYDEYYFRPKAIFRIVRKAVFNNVERKRLYKEAKDFMKLRSVRNKAVKVAREQQAKSNINPKKNEPAEPVNV
ncbi:Fe-S protein, radical SAM family [Candidatus Koribacter versatilis Ellin345]|uniref:Fe-S protein, radical SAM family n=1 Tax=Koribacter versatilis (strain Ellin345) TaxID=204669 RepID=Q1IP80_KORVE|nr:hopanoid biosynthesis associated radical SAM protein HpnJ [Candidatus Koribacter versatilis]ABF41320.1 Fe-S protein, radical SAM family [Candidatus Koribacter versatilis Ellin345]